jgi:GH15 family glucan-1,4-alpha-glucosidase
MFAPGWPGIPARWTSSAKSGLGTAVSRDSRVWFTLSHGILNEIYYPRVDHACMRDLRFIVTGAVLGHSLIDMREVIDCAVSKVRLAAGEHRRERLLVTTLLEDVAAAGAFHSEYRKVDFKVGPINPRIAVDGDPQLVREP